MLTFVQNFFLPPFLFVCFLSFISVFFYSSDQKNNSILKDDLTNKIKKKVLKLNGQKYTFLCLLEDVPQSSLKGQFYALMSPLTCLLEDAPQSSLKGQFYVLAYPLMSPFACVVTQTWHNFYRQNLGNTNINYWLWKDKPESNNFSEELTNLFKLPQPSSLAQKVIENFAKTKQENPQNYHHQFWQKVKTYGAFFHWHQTGMNILEENELIQVYKVCFKVNKEQIQNVTNYFNELLLEKSISWWIILNVNSQANLQEVDISYKKLLKRWHPDINYHPYAHHITARINLAYEEYKEYLNKAEFSKQYRREKLNNIWKKFEKAIKLLWKQHLTTLISRE